MTRIFTINEGIQHLEDMDLEKFIHVVSNLSKMDASEKMDGSELAFGFDDDGKFYTTRGAKGQKGVHYNVKEYLHGGGGPTFAAAHQALKSVEDKLKEVMKPGEAIEIEVLYGRQPNAIVYGLDGLNYIAFLRTIQGTNLDMDVDKTLVDKVAKKLKDEKVTITSDFPTSDDGMTIRKESVTTSWKFTRAPKVDVSKIETTDVKEEITRLRKYLEAANDVAKKHNLPLTNFEVATLNLTSIPKDVREDFKKERDQVNSKILTEFKLPIKEKLLKSFNRKVKPELQGEVKQGEVAGIEGIVFVDPETNETFKLVDKDTFTSINQFNFMVRKRLFSVVRSTDPDASLEARGGIVGTMKFRIMSLLGIPEATRGFNLKKILGDLDGDSPEDTLAKFAEGYKDVDYMAYRHKISAIIQATMDEVKDTLDDFKKNYKTFKLKLKDGSEIGYSDEIVKRTLLTFAEIRDYLKSYKSDIDKTRTMKDMLGAIVGNVIEKIHEPSLMESVRKQIAQKQQNQLKKGNGMLIQEVAKLVEDGDGGGAAPAATTSAGDVSGACTSAETKPASGDTSLLAMVTRASSIASVPYRLFKGKVVRRIPRKIEKRKKFTKNKAPIYSNK